MVSKVLSIVLLALVGQAICTLEVTLPDHTVNHISNNFIGTSFTIPKFFLDELVSCHVVFPTNIIYEAWPNSNIPVSNIFFADAAAPFRSCAIGLRGVGLEAAGTYQLISVHNDYSGLGLVRTTQRFHLNLQLTEVEFPTRP